MIDLLKEKIEGWTRDKLIAYNDNNFVPFLPKKSTFIQEMFDNGLCVYNEHSARFYFNNGDISSVTDKFTHNDWMYYELLYTNRNTFRMSKLIEYKVLTVAGNESMYLKFESPTGQLGTPVYALKDTTEFYKLYIDYVTWIIEVLDKHNTFLPDVPIDPIKIIKDDQGFYFCPIAGPENFLFGQDKDKFIKNQIGQLMLISHNINPDDNQNQTDWDYLKEYAKSEWYSFKTARNNK
jgi:hypothetical protein